MSKIEKDIIWEIVDDEKFVIMKLVVDKKKVVFKIYKSRSKISMFKIVDKNVCKNWCVMYSIEKIWQQEMIMTKKNANKLFIDDDVEKEQKSFKHEIVNKVLIQQ